MADDNDKADNIKEMYTIRTLIVGTMILLFVIVVLVLVYIIIQLSKMIKSSTQSSVTPFQSPGALSENDNIQDEVHITLEARLCGVTTHQHQWRAES